MTRKPILCLDFDGVCHLYTSGWKGADVIPDGPVPGLFGFLEKANQIFDIQIFSSRSRQPGGIEAMKKWFSDELLAEGYGVQTPLDDSLNYMSFCRERCHNVPEVKLTFPTEKPPAMVSLDDRALTFTGTWPDIEVLQNFQPWTKKGVQYGLSELWKGRSR